MATTPTLAELAYAEWQKAAELERQTEVYSARAYYEGEQTVTLTDRMRTLLGVATSERVKYRLNIIRPIIRAVTERLMVTGFTAAETDGSETDAADTQAAQLASANMAQFCMNVWDANKLDVKQDSIYTDAENEGESFVLVDWDNATMRPRFTPHARFVDTSANGDGFGCKIMYENDDVNQPVSYAVKRWREELGQGKVRSRLTRYYPDRIEKYEIKGTDYIQFRDEGDEGWPIAWTARDGSPLGVPVFHFTAPDERPSAFDAWGVQDGIIQTFIDLLGSNRITAFRIFVAMGWIPTSDGQPLKSDLSNVAKIEPGMVIGTTKGPNDASFDTIEGESPEAFIKTLDQMIYWAAITTDTPISRFQITGQVSSAESQKQYDAPLIAKVVNRQMRHGDTWENAMRFAARLANTYGNAGLDETAMLDALWKPAEPRSITDKQLEASALKASGIPEEAIWRQVWDYTQAEIDAMKLEDSYQRKVQQTSVLGAFGNG